jgi:hypothetical protein
MASTTAAMTMYRSHLLQLLFGFSSPVLQQSFMLSNVLCPTDDLPTPYPSEEGSYNFKKPPLERLRLIVVHGKSPLGRGRGGFSIPKL